VAGLIKRKLKPETLEQIAVFDWIRAVKLDKICWHCPNEAKRSPWLGKLLLRMGMLPGVSDITLARAKQGYHGFYIELKAKNSSGYYGKPTNTQLEFIDNMRKEGYRAEVCNGADEAIMMIREYLEL
jgi:hypothetical protein